MYRLAEFKKKKKEGKKLAICNGNALNYSLHYSLMLHLFSETFFCALTMLIKYFVIDFFDSVPLLNLKWKLLNLD